MEYLSIHLTWGNDCLQILGKLSLVIIFRNLKNIFFMINQQKFSAHALYSKRKFFCVLFIFQLNDQIDRIIFIKKQIKKKLIDKIMINIIKSFNQPKLLCALCTLFHIIKQRKHSFILTKRKTSQGVLSFVKLGLGINYFVSYGIECIKLNVNSNEIKCFLTINVKSITKETTSSLYCISEKCSRGNFVKGNKILTMETRKIKKKNNILVMTGINVINQVSNCSYVKLKTINANFGF
ncbi:hypothetical protein BpHYR1_036347 [Brachionus plicatilis]|uniref:Uncharacterized protein n=1 Tax=Brachionus plicatilis TaxID=10195 RepID=A0A3M7PYB5_BRAPC|nr:hypothetical protein BpHYR1_036347 [Brachionus plicatilis]